MDYNKDRQVKFEENIDTDDQLFVDKVDASLDYAKATIYLNTMVVYCTLCRM